MSLAANAVRGPARPPAKGSFPLDREHQCSAEQQRYLRCLTQRQQQQQQQVFEVYDHLPCRVHAKAFLQCRMDANLMLREEMSILGFPESPEAAAAAAAEDTPLTAVAEGTPTAAAAERSKEETGYLAGIQTLQPYTSRGFFGRVAARFSWPKQLLFPFFSRSSSSSSSNSSNNNDHEAPPLPTPEPTDSRSRTTSSSSSSSGGSSIGFERPDDFPCSSSNSSGSSNISNNSSSSSSNNNNGSVL